MNQLLNLTWDAGKRLALFALIMLSLTSVVYVVLRAPMAEQQQSALLAKFRELTPNVVFNEHFLHQHQTRTFSKLHAEHYIAPSGEHYFDTTTPRGYSGNIRLLIALSPDFKTVLGVRVLEHKETPGLGDKIERRISDWILSFDNTSLATKRFAVRKDGGDFDAFTGATITPRAIVHHVRLLLTTLENETPNLPPSPESALYKEQP